MEKCKFFCENGEQEIELKFCPGGLHSATKASFKSGEPGIVALKLSKECPSEYAIKNMTSVLF